MLVISDEVCVESPGEVDRGNEETMDDDKLGGRAYCLSMML